MPYHIHFNQAVVRNTYILDFFFSFPEKAIITKWHTIRDGYVKAKKNWKELHKSGAGRTNIHQYVYADLLPFLNKCVQLREIEESTLKASTSNNIIESIATSPTSPPTTFAKKLTAPAIEEDISNYLQTATEMLHSQKSTRAEVW